MVRCRIRCLPATRGRTFSVTPPVIKPSLRPPRGAEGPLVIGPRGGTEVCDWLDIYTKSHQILPNLK